MGKNRFVNNKVNNFRSNNKIYWNKTKKSSNKNNKIL